MTDRLFRINCGYQNYDWGKVGSNSAVARFAKKSDSQVQIDENKPYAELWMGTHKSVPSVAVEPENIKGKTLREVIESNPEFYLHKSVEEKFGKKELPYLFKVLSIEKVLSIQAHPDKKLGAQLHAADPKNYPDGNHKPEMAVCVTDFQGFCGFKPLKQLAQTLEKVPELSVIVGDTKSKAFIQEIVPEAKQGSPEDKNNRKLLLQIFEAVMRAPEHAIKEQTSSLVSRAERKAPELREISEELPALIVRLNKQFPNDVGLLCGCLMLNHVHLSKGDAMFLQAKEPHAYISGDIIECMAASDNVVRVGFTPKFKDVDNLVSMLTYSYEPVENQKMKPLSFSGSTGQASVSTLYDPPIEEFAVLVTVFDKLGLVQHHAAIQGPSIIICTNGRGTITAKGLSPRPISAGLVYFIAPDTEIDLTSEHSEENFTTYRAFVEAS